MSLRRTIRIALSAVTLTAVSAFASGCASSNYLSNRGRDAADMMTLTVGTGAGARLRAGPVQLAVINNSDLAGLRSGQFFANGADMQENAETFAPLPDLYEPVWMDPVAVEVFERHTDKKRDSKMSDYRDEHSRIHSRYPVRSWDATFGSEVFSPEEGDPAYIRGKAVYGVSPFPLVSLGSRPEYYFALEFSGGLAFTLRFGINLAEIADFLMGITTFDLLGDDIRPAAQKE